MSLRITTTGVFCESRVGNGKVLAMAVEECYDVGARVETQHTAPESASASLLNRVAVRSSCPFGRRCANDVGTHSARNVSL